MGASISVLGILISAFLPPATPAKTPELLMAPLDPPGRANLRKSIVWEARRTHLETACIPFDVPMSVSEGYALNYVKGLDVEQYKALKQTLGHRGTIGVIPTEVRQEPDLPRRWSAMT